MNERGDLPRALPDAPPPRPAQRRAAIEKAMARFDGREIETPAHAEAPRARSRLRWPQLSALATAALVGVVSVSLWNSSDYHGAPPPRSSAPAVEEQAAAPAEAPAPVRELVPEEPAPAVVAPSLKRGPGIPAAPVTQRAAEAVAPPAPAAVEVSAPPPPPPAPPPPASAARARGETVVAEDIGSFPDADGIVVTGTRMRGAFRAQSQPDEPMPQARVASGRGDWNACTIDDPARSLAACRSVVDPAAPGKAGRADAQIADGLTRAWAGDHDGAIAAFDRAIDLAGKSSFAYLNRGLVRERSGDVRGALGDLDKAVRLSPQSARVYYHRSLVRERRGDTGGARADAKRAVALDPAYRAVIR
ncbi:tetratricopeptide repeat protein [Sphingomonas sp. DT-207]|uniref:tetratricopeptide repeat protein n=1 Tax=Sphingomonas sp. DT-207 TaxID=3396167 RepID=UPI003F1DF108